MEDYDLEKVSLYIRGKAADPENAKSDIEKAFGKVKFLSADNAPSHDVAFVTEKDTERTLKEKLKSLSSELEPLNVLRFPNLSEHCRRMSLLGSAYFPNDLFQSISVRLI